jgi:DNA-binding cell septation regulator SpoVG
MKIQILRIKKIQSQADPSLRAYIDVMLTFDDVFLQVRDFRIHSDKGHFRVQSSGIKINKNSSYSSIINFPQETWRVIAETLRVAYREADMPMEEEQNGSTETGI